MKAISRSTYERVKELLSRSPKLSLRQIQSKVKVSRGTVESISNGTHYYDKLDSKPKKTQPFYRSSSEPPSPPPPAPPEGNDLKVVRCPDCGGEVYSLPCWLCYVRWECNTAGVLPNGDPAYLPPLLPYQSQTFSFSLPETPEEAILSSRIREASRLKREGKDIMEHLPDLSHSPYSRK